MNREQVHACAGQILRGRPLERAEAAALAEMPAELLPELFAAASRIREHHRGRLARCCSIVAARVGACGEDCAFCSQSGHYRTAGCRPGELTAEQVLQACEAAASDGAEAFGVVNSGYAPDDGDIERWGRVIRAIRDRGAVRACASMGCLDAEQARRLAEWGTACYNHNLQTSRRFFPRIVTTHSYDDRLATLRHVRQAGMMVCSGALFGMGETWADRLDLLLELRELGPDIVPLNFLIPIPGTPLEHQARLPALECLRIIALTRLILPDKEIKVAGGREACLGDLQSWIFLAGADSFLIGNYLTTPGRSPAEDRRMVRDLGLTLARPAQPRGGTDQDLPPAAAPAAHPCCGRNQPV